MAIRRLATAAALAAISSAMPAMADEIRYQNPDKTVTVTGGVGLMWIRADEYVFTSTANDDMLSYLQWESSAVPVFDGEVRIDLPGRFLLKGTVEIATGGDGYMVDYDWISPFARGTGPNDWSDRSQHGATDLDHFFGGSLALGYEIVQSETLTLGLMGGAQYRDAKWTAYGGDYVYSYYRRHDTSFTESNDVRVISYQQKIPAAFLGIDLKSTHGRWTLSASAKGGVTIGATALDDHWQRPLFFKEAVDAGPTLALAADISYALSDSFNVNIGASFDQVFKARSDSETYDPIRNMTYYDPGLSGAGQRTFKLKASLSGKF